MSSYPRVRPVGDAALTVEFGDAIDPRLNAAVRALDRQLAEHPLPGVLEAVPTYRSLLVAYDPGQASFAPLAGALLQRATLEGLPLPPGPLRTIPTVYGGGDGPDLAEVAAACGLREEEVVELHTSQEFTALMLGFMPGFAYLGLLPESLAVPRRATPRPRVPGGSVGIAGRQTGIYPRASPGGWRLIGRTSARMFDASARTPTLIQPGDRVRFARAFELAEDGGVSTLAATGGTPSIDVIAPGLLTTVQAAGRWGHRRLGVAAAGPLDPLAHAAANRAVGNAVDAAALEVTLVGPMLRFLRTVRVAVSGADLGPVLERADLGAWEVPSGQAFLARPDNVLRFQGRKTGCRAYVAFDGGIEVPVVLESRSTDLTGGFGGHEGRRLRAGDVLSVGRGSRGGAPEATSPLARGPDVATLHVVLGPQDDHFAPDVLRRFLGETWSVTAASDRVGCRLSGEAIAAAGPSEIVSDGMVPGCIQVPPDGQPIVMLADGPTTGGYPKIATVITADLGRLGQLVPGHGRVRFEALK